MSEKRAGFKWVLDPSRFLCLAEVKKLMETTRKRPSDVVVHGNKALTYAIFPDVRQSLGGTEMTKIASNSLAILACGV